MNEIETTHCLPFEIAPWEYNIQGAPHFDRFRVGTCTGLCGNTKDSYDILAIENSSQGNGHLQDVFEWFEHSCRRDKRKLRVLEVWNKKFKKHLLKKRGFVGCGGDNVEKTF